MPRHLSRALLVAGWLLSCAPPPVLSPSWRRIAGAPERRAAEPERWWRVVLHVHSVLNFVWLYDDEREIAHAEREDAELRDRGLTSRMQSYDPRAVRDLTLRAARRGADALVLTEHNTLVHAEDPFLPPRIGRTHLFRRATEWTSWSKAGHALVFGLRALVRPRSTRGARVEDFAALVEAARAQGATVVVAHPTTPNSPWKKRLPSGVHAVEVLNSWPFDGRDSEALWHEALRGGARLGAVAGADWHASLGPPIPGGWRVTEVRAAELGEEAIYAAIAAGRTVAVESSRPAPRLRLRVAGRCREGDECALPPGPFSVEVSVDGGPGLTLELFDERSPSPSEPAVRLPVEGRRFRALFGRSLGAGPGFVRAVLRGATTVALGSPVYVRPHTR